MPHAIPRFAVLWLALAAAASVAQEFVAPYVPTTQQDLQRMLDLAEVGPGDYLIDLGSGDGRIVIAAAERGARGHGVELDAKLVALARERARSAGVEDRVEFREGDVFDADLSRATVVTLYLMPEVNLQLRPKLLAELRPGARLLSNSFDMAEWTPEQHVAGRASGGLMLWTIPARVQGGWTLAVEDARFELAFDQHFQSIGAAFTAAAGAAQVRDATLHGDRIALVVEDGIDRYEFRGRVVGERMQGLVQIHSPGGSREARWTAVRQPGSDKRRS